MVHSSAYHPASNRCAERGIKTVKEQLKKHGIVSPLQLAEIIFSINTREQPGGVGHQWPDF